MCSATESNRWAPRLVIVLQLATWSIVGIVLLQRGANSLRSGNTNISDDRKSAAQIQVPAASLSNRQDIQDTLECQEKEVQWEEINGKDTNAVRKDDRRDSGSDGSSLKNKEPCVSRIAENDRNARISNGNLRKRMRPARARDRIAQEQLLATDEKKKSLSEDSGKDYLPSITSSEEFNLENSDASTKEQQNGSLSEQITPDDANTGIASSSRGEAPRPKPMDRAGAAAAVAMLAIGVVMLLLAPAIVILRAIEASRRERRLPKLRARKDLPPTYEEATFMDEAPRYSSLHLNTINEPTPETALTSPSTAS